MKFKFMGFESRCKREHYGLKEAIFIATWLGYFNACLNSLVYSLLNNNFRMSCAKLLCAWHYNRERRQQYGLNQLKHFGDTPIQLALGRVPWNKL
ncbi:unnamed protein product [Schistosoma margrebowiei]|uniref:Uncharacterized protein n=1 Tax=Schistosoma margrebowiei TaxID=48269 RepID=A0A183M436_9TREM|nr:unnamed protein product [Schistosoma margrebowiei]